MPLLSFRSTFAGRGPGPRARRLAALGLVLGVGLAAGPAPAAPAGPKASSPAPAPTELNGFSLTQAAVPVREIVPGGPPKDGIPALTSPKTLSAAKAPWDDEEVVIGVVEGGQARAYPTTILLWHEVVNDTLGGRPILVTYGPFCGTGMVFDRRIQGQARQFGVSGLLYHSNMLMYDRKTQSLWSQMAEQAITGPSKGQQLLLLRSRMARWGAWKKAHPKTTVLSPDTGYRRPYGRSPYGDYATSKRLAFPAPLDRRFHPKMPTIGMIAPDGRTRAYPASEIAMAGGSVTDRLSGKQVQVSYDPDEEVFHFHAPDDFQVVEGYWFAWAAFHPRTTVYRAPEKSPGRVD